MYNPNSTDRFVKCNFTFLTKGKYYNNQQYSLRAIIPGESKCGWGFSLCTNNLSIFYDKNNKKLKINFNNFKEDRLTEFDIKQIKNESESIDSIELASKSKEDKPIKYTIKLLKVNNNWSIYFNNNDKNERFIKFTLVLYDKNMQDCMCTHVKDKFKSDPLSENMVCICSLNTPNLTNDLPFISTDRTIKIGLRDFEVWA